MWAAEKGHLDCLKHLHETAKAPWDENAVREAHKKNHPECLQYCLDNDCPLPGDWSYEGGVLHTTDSDDDYYDVTDEDDDSYTHPW